MPSIERPVTISPSLWGFLCSSAEAYSVEVLSGLLGEEGYDVTEMAEWGDVISLVSENPGPFLLRVGVLKRPELLLGAVLSVRVDPGVEVDYVIRERTVEALVRGDGIYTIFRLLDDRELRLTHEELVRVVFGGGLVDYLEKKGN